MRRQERCRLFCDGTKCGSSGKTGSDEKGRNEKEGLSELDGIPKQVKHQRTNETFFYIHISAIVFVSRELEGSLLQ